MTTAPAPAKAITVPAHSHTSLRQYEQCPYRFYMQRILKAVQDKGGKASEYGDMVHKALEFRVREGRPLPDSLKHLEPLAQFVTDVQGIVSCESQLGCRADMTPCGFFDSGVWLRGKIDVLVNQGEEAIILDYKTGKYRGDDGQPARNAILVFANFPMVRLIRSRFLYIQDNKVDKKEFARTDLREIMTPTLRIENDIRWSANNNAWPKRPTGLCRYCPVTTCENFKGDRV